MATYIPQDATGVLISDVSKGTQTNDVKVTLDSEKVAISAIDAGDNNIGNVDVASSALPTGAATETTLGTVHGHVDSIDGKITACNTGAVVVASGAITETNSSAIKTAVEIIDDWDSSDHCNVRHLNATDDVVVANLSATDNAVLDQIELNTDPLLVVGTGTEATAQRVTIATDSTGVLSVDDNGSSLTVDNATISVVGSGTEATAQRVTIATDSTGVLSVDDNGSTLSIDDGAGTITVDNADITSCKTALELLDNSVDGNYLNTNMNIAGTDVAAGAGAVSAQTQRVTHASDDPVTTAVQLIDNIVTSINGPGAPTVDSYTQKAINLAAGANQVLVSSAANKQIWVYGIGFTVNVAGTVSFQDEDDTAITGIMQFSALGGISHSPSGNFAMPTWKLATDKDLEVDVVTSELDGWLSYAIVSV